jgi:tRNA pseudouridine13 synthase
MRNLPDPLNLPWVLQDQAPWRALAHAFVDPGDYAALARGQLRVSAEDFVVEEILGFAPDGDGEHQLLHVRKRDLNTIEVARALARHAGCPLRDVGYCGLKDRRAVATQWFSVLAAREIDWSGFDDTHTQVLAACKHRRKLRRGSHQGNRFHLTVRELETPLDMLERRLGQIRRCGVPNYFGEQRFGRNGRNLEEADKMFSQQVRVPDRHRRSLFLSAARSWIFNCVVSKRVVAKTWDKLLPGDVAGLDGSRSIFSVPHLDAELTRRTEEGDIHPTGPLVGQGELSTQGEPRAIEQEVLVNFADWCSGLEAAGMRQERRPVRLLVPDLSWQLEPTALEMTFTLPRGGFATSVLRECVSSTSRFQSE